MRVIDIEYGECQCDRYGRRVLGVRRWQHPGTGERRCIVNRRQRNCPDGSVTAQPAIVDAYDDDSVEC